MSVTSDLHSGCRDGPPLSVSAIVVIFFIVFRLLAIDHRFGFESALNQFRLVNFKKRSDFVSTFIFLFVPG